MIECCPVECPTFWICLLGYNLTYSSVSRIFYKLEVSFEWLVTKVMVHLFLGRRVQDYFIGRAVKYYLYLIVPLLGMLRLISGDDDISPFHCTFPHQLFIDWFHPLLIVTWMNYFIMDHTILKNSVNFITFISWIKNILSITRTVWLSWNIICTEKTR